MLLSVARPRQLIDPDSQLPETFSFKVLSDDLIFKGLNHFYAFKNGFLFLF